MKKQTKRNINRICGFIGVCFLIAATALLACWQWEMYASQQKAASYVRMIRERIPEPQGAALEERSNNTMPVLWIAGTDFAGILEIPKYGSELPVSAEWGNLSQYPSRFGGNVYDRTLQIGATTQKGQYDFYRGLSVGDSVFFTDMEGNRFGYEIADIRYEKHTDQAALRREGAALVLFIKNIYGLEYIIVTCSTIS